MSQTSFSFRYALPAILWALLLFFLSSLPSNSVPSLGIEYEDLVAHFVVYSVLGYFLAIAFLHQPERITRKTIVLAALLGILYGASDEIHQMFVPGRNSTLSDFVADGLGVLVGVVVFLRYPAIFKMLRDKVFA
ncbi:MAG: VanZ family protein [bacterium]